MNLYEKIREIQEQKDMDDETMLRLFCEAVEQYPSEFVKRFEECLKDDLGL